MPKETGIIMSGSHPVDILEGRKTMTRRTWGLKEINRNPDAWEHFGFDQAGRFSFRWIDGDRILNLKCPHGQVGDRLWVKETYTMDWWQAASLIVYKADVPDPNAIYDPIMKETSKPHWKPSIFMPRWASRITLEITEIRVQRVQKITANDACAEGIGDYGRSTPQLKFKVLWDSLNAKRGYSWEVNPWVWVIRFKLVDSR